MADQNLPQETRRDLAAIRLAITNLRRLSGGLRLFAIDPQDSEGDQGTTVIKDWWESIELLIRRSVSPSVKLEIDIPSDIPELAVGPHQLTHMVLNIVQNAGDALKNDPNGVVRIYFSDAPEADSVLLAIADNGPGMSENTRRHACDPFYTTKTRRLSTGLGLSQVHSICQSVKGSIEIFSSPGEGATVLLTLPAASAPVNSEEAWKQRTARISVPDQRIACYLKALLATAGFEVLENDELEEDHVMLWIGSGETIHPETALEFLQGDPVRTAIIIDTDHARWTMPGVTMVDGSHQQLRAAVQAIAHRSAFPILRGART